MGHAQRGGARVKTFVTLFISSATFGAAIALSYWFVSHEPTGTVLLGVMTGALLFTAGYAILGERDADLAGDAKEETPPEAAGEDLGIFTTESAWPILTAVSVLGMLVGLLWSPFLAVVGLAGLILCLWRLGAEAARV